MRPNCRKLLKVFPAIIIWSKTLISIIIPASTKFLVTFISSLDGSAFPDGWLCNKMIEAALSEIAILKTSLGCTILLFNVPSLTRTSLKTLFFEFKSKV